MEGMGSDVYVALDDVALQTQSKFLEIETQHCLYLFISAPLQKLQQYKKGSDPCFMLGCAVFSEST